MFTTLIVQPLFNLLVLIYALIPGHNFGLAIIIFTIIVRLLMWPLVKRQLHQTKKMRQLQPELKRIKAEAKGNKQKESMLMMELYRKRGINPLASLAPLIIQLPIFIGLYSGLRRIVTDPHQLVAFAYTPIQHISWMQHVTHNIHAFDETLFGIVNLSRSAISPSGIYWPAMIIVVASSIVQYYQAKQLQPSDKDAKSLRQILREASEGKQADSSEMNAAIGRSTRFILPIMIFLFTFSIASALSLYWLTSGLVAYIQQGIVLGKDEEEMEDLADAKTKDVKDIPEAEIVSTPPKTKTTKKRAAAKKHKKRRK